MSQWREIELGQCVSMISGGTPSKDNEAYWNGSIPWASAKDLKSFLLHDTQDHISEIGSKSGTKISPKGSILVLVRGMTLHNDFPICRITQDMAFNQDIKAIISNESILDTGYLAYWLLSSKYQLMSLVESASHGTGRINTDVLKSFKISCPPLQEQKAISQILENFDTKIDNFRKQNETLEEIARSIFKHWFIDFEFPNDDGKPYKSSGGVMVRSELGDIPEGWHVGKLGDIAKNIKNGIRESEIKPEMLHVGLEHIPRKCIALNSWEKAVGVASNKFKFAEGNILFGKLRPYFHKVVIAPIAGICSTDILVIDSKDKTCFEIVLMLVSSDDFIRYVTLASEGTRMPRTNWEYMKDYPIVIPSLSIAKKFNELLHPSIKKLKVNIFQIQTLTNVRDTLLPKLMSGQLRVEV